MYEVVVSSNLSMCCASTMRTTAVQISGISGRRCKSVGCFSTQVLALLSVLSLLSIWAPNWSSTAAPSERPPAANASTDHVGTDSKVAVGSSFVTTSGYQFLLDGKPLYVNGANLYWLMTYATSNSSTVTEILEQAAAVGVTVVRTWAFADGATDNVYPLQISPGVYDEAVFQGLDFVVSEAKKYGIRLILSLVNNYADCGGKRQYVSWANTYAGASLDSDDDFFSDATIRGWFKNYIETVLTRVNSILRTAYRDEPTIFAWELMNEPRCTTDNAGNTFQAWAEEMAAYVKSLDGNHLLEIGLEGFYSSIVSPSSVPEEGSNPTNINAHEMGTDFIRNNQVFEVDFATVHSYPDNWIPSLTENEKRTFMGTWVRTHIDDCESTLKKPVLFSEFGKSDRTFNYTESMRVSAMNDMFDAVYDSAVQGGAGAGALVWQLVTTSTRSSLSDGFEIVLTDSPSITYLMQFQASRLSSI